MTNIQFMFTDTHACANTQQLKKRGLQTQLNDWRTCVHLNADDWLHCVKVKLTSFLEETGVGGGKKKKAHWPRRTVASSIPVMNKGTVVGLAGAWQCLLQASNPDGKLEGSPYGPGFPAAL